MNLPGHTAPEVLAALHPYTHTRESSGTRSRPTAPGQKAGHRIETTEQPPSNPHPRTATQSQLPHSTHRCINDALTTASHPQRSTCLDRNPHDKGWPGIESDHPASSSAAAAARPRCRPAGCIV